MASTLVPTRPAPTAPEMPTDPDTPGGEAPRPSSDASAPEMPPGSLPLVALALGIAGTALGLTMIWFFAAIPLGVGACGVGIVAVRRGVADRDRTRAVLGVVLGGIALLLGLLGAVFMPQLANRLDDALTNVESSESNDIQMVDRSLSSDVNRLDATVTRDLKRLEDQNHADLLQVERGARELIEQLGVRLDSEANRLSAEGRQDLATLEQRLSQDVTVLRETVRTIEDSLRGEVTALDTRVRALEKKLAAK